MADGTRERILGRLREAGRTAVPAAAPDVSVVSGKSFPPAERLPRLRRCMEAVHTEFLEATPATWADVVRAELRASGARTLGYGPGTAAAAALEASAADGLPPVLVPYDRPVEELKGTLFGSLDGGFTTCLGGIAETGSLVLIPSAEEPRLLSLVPPIHVVLLDSSRMWDTFWHALSDLGLAAGMPPNALLVSGPSKTADIEQTLAYGVHGPKRLLVVVVQGDRGASRPGTIGSPPTPRS